jgi:hypothetical protein
VRLWPFGRKPKQEHYLGEYTEPSFRGAIGTLVFIVIALVLIWLAYSWALNQPGIHDPNGLLNNAARLAAAVIR